MYVCTLYTIFTKIESSLDGKTWTSDIEDTKIIKNPCDIPLYFQRFSPSCVEARRTQPTYVQIMNVG